MQNYQKLSAAAAAAAIAQHPAHVIAQCELNSPEVINFYTLLIAFVAIL